MARVDFKQRDCADFSPYSRLVLTLVVTSDDSCFTVTPGVSGCLITYSPHPLLLAIHLISCH